jgi:predicted RNA-binding protein with PIN domain
LPANKESAPDYIIDAYNVMHADDELESLMGVDLEAARDSLIGLFSDFCAREGVHAELVFDAGGRPGGISRERVGSLLTVIYTAQGQSADDYIEKMVYKNRPERGASRIVVTGDYAQQRIVQGAGLLRMSPREFLSMVAESKEEQDRRIAPEKAHPRKVRLADRLSDEKKSALERLKRQQK